MAAKAMTMDEFLDHSGSSTTGGSVLSWKEDGSIDVLLHPQAPFYSIWSSSWFVLGKDRESGKEALYYSRFNSYEDEKTVLTKQRYRGDDNEFEVKYPWHDKPVSYHGAREYPPVLCPFSLLIEWVREAIETDKIGWLDKIFDIDTDEGHENATIIHAGGFTGLFGGKDLDEKELTALKKAGIKRSESYKEEGKPRMQYVMCVVPYKKPGDGVTVAIEAESLGKKFKQHIKDLRDDGRDPREKPCVFRWKYDDAEQFSNKYAVAVRLNDEIGPEHRAALAEPYPQEKVDRIVSDSNLVQLREGFERWWCHDVVPPWDAIFAPAMERYKGTDVAKPPRDFDAPAADDEASDDEGEAEVKGAENEAKGGDAEADDLVECTHCHKAMPETADTCPECGATYDADGNMTPPKPKEEPKPMRSRSAAAAGTRAPKRGSKS